MSTTQSEPLRHAERSGSSIAVSSKVRLKSGGPLMTVEKDSCPNRFGWSYSARLLTCVWFEGTELRRSSFPPAVLESSND